MLGRWSFRHIDLAVDRRVLIPRPETEVVAGAAIELAAAVDGPRMIADLGTGSGAIGLSAATELPVRDTTVWLTDVREDALAVARANLAGIGRAAVNVRIGIGSWFEALPNDQCFDVIVSNPPYVAVDSPELDESVSDLGTRGGSVRRARRARRDPGVDRGCARHTCVPTGGSCWRSAPIRGARWRRCSTTPGTSMSRSATT